MRSTAMTLALVVLLGSMCAYALAADAPPPVELHGYMQNRVYLASGANPEFRSERISLSAKANLPENRVGYVELYFHPWVDTAGTYLESAYFDTPFGDGRLRVGKGRRMTFGITPSYPNRRTSNYGLVSEAFTQDRIQGVQFMVEKETIDFGATIQTGYRLGTRALGEIPGDSARNATHQVPHLCFRDATGTFPLSQKLALSTRLGGHWQNGLRAGISYYLGTLDKRDVDALAGTSTSLSPGSTPALIPGATDDGMSVLGLDATYKLKGGYVLQGEFYDASVSDLDYNAWNFLVGREMASGWKFFARYSQQNMDVTPTANPLSWDTRQLSLSLVQPIGKALWIQYEYERNTEKPPVGTSSVKNDLFFVELFTGF